MESIKNLIPLAVKGNQVPVKQESKPSVTIEERQLHGALQECRICNSTEEELKQALRSIYVMIGLKGQNIPVNEEKQILHEFIVENYGGHTPAELKLAFKLAITRKLDLKPADVVCYENFSIAYFSRIMEAYRDWSREQIKMLPAPEIKPREFNRQEKLQLDFDYAYLLLKEINKMPCRV